MSKSGFDWQQIAAALKHASPAANRAVTAIILPGGRDGEHLMWSDLDADDQLLIARIVGLA